MTAKKKAATKKGPQYLAVVEAHDKQYTSITFATEQDALSDAFQLLDEDGEDMENVRDIVVYTVTGYTTFDAERPAVPKLTRRTTVTY